MSEKSSAVKSRWVRAIAAVDRNDLAGLLGAALVTGGLWEMHPPTAMIVLGVLLLALAVVGARNGNASKS
ncbi:MAG TPA: hypothetical protein VGA88_00890 [Burkholderiales bacterium]